MILKGLRKGKGEEDEAERWRKGDNCGLAPLDARMERRQVGTSHPATLLSQRRRLWKQNAFPKIFFFSISLLLKSLQQVFIGKHGHLKFDFQFDFQLHSGPH